MKLRNKETGGLANLIVDKDTLRVKTDAGWADYSSLAELNEEWEDYEEPKEYWFINSCGAVNVRNEDEDLAVTDMHKQFHNYFESEEEAERVLAKLKAYKRLKDKGFKFWSWEWKTQKINYEFDFTVLSEEGEKEAEQDLDLLFGEEEE